MSKARRVHKPGSTKPRGRRPATEWLKSLATGFVVFPAIRITLVQTFTIISGSMENTLLVGDFLYFSVARADPGGRPYALPHPRWKRIGARIR